MEVRGLAAYRDAETQDGPFAAGGTARDAPERPLPDYLENVYWWAYLRPGSVRFFDRPAIVSAILWGQYRRLCDIALAQVEPGMRVLQTACVYGALSERLARKVGPSGRLDIIDAAPIQADNLRRKLAGMAQAHVAVADATEPAAGRHDTVICFFLLHEVPDAEKRAVVASALDAVDEGGRAVFVDYGRPARLHPLRPVMTAVFRLLEPFARSMWTTGIPALAPDGAPFRWTRTPVFGGLYQVVVAKREGPCQTRA